MITWPTLHVDDAGVCAWCSRWGTLDVLVNNAGTEYPTPIDDASPDAMCDAVREFARHGATKLVIVNGHYENQWFLIEGIDLGLGEGEWQLIEWTDAA